MQITTLNLGGRNANTFEIMLSNDESALGKRWIQLYERGRQRTISTGSHQKKITYRRDRQA